MKTRTIRIWGIQLLALIIIAGQPHGALARTNIYVGVDLGGFVRNVDAYEYNVRPLPPPPCPPREVYREIRYYPPPSPVYYGEYREYRPVGYREYREVHYPRHRRHHHHGRGDRW